MRSSASATVRRSRKPLELRAWVRMAVKRSISAAVAGRGFFEGAMEFGGGFGVADQFVEADGDGLAEVHGAMLGAGGDAQEPVAVAEIFVGQAGFFRAEEERDAGCFERAARLRARGCRMMRAPASSVQS